jgi:predicted nuclease of restriction endonuclease-like (RecB) superfamily
MQIESGLHRRQGHAETNFAATLPAPQSDLAQQLLKDPYNFDFLALSAEAHERGLRLRSWSKSADFYWNSGAALRAQTVVCLHCCPYAEIVS